MRTEATGSKRPTAKWFQTWTRNKTKTKTKRDAEKEWWQRMSVRMVNRYLLHYVMCVLEKRESRQLSWPRLWPFVALCIPAKQFLNEDGSIWKCWKPISWQQVIHTVVAQVPERYDRIRRSPGTWQLFRNKNDNNKQLSLVGQFKFSFSRIDSVGSRMVAILVSCRRAHAEGWKALDWHWTLSGWRGRRTYRTTKSFVKQAQIEWSSLIVLFLRVWRGHHRGSQTSSKIKSLTAKVTMDSNWKFAGLSLLLDRSWVGALLLHSSEQ